MDTIARTAGGDTISRTVGGDTVDRTVDADTSARTVDADPFVLILRNVGSILMFVVDEHHWVDCVT